jgi:peptide/nickel transport system permease protein
MYRLSRLFSTLAYLGLVSFVLFALFHVLPGNPSERIPREASIEEVRRLEALHGLDRPIAVRYACWLAGNGIEPCRWWSGRGLLAGDLGRSAIRGTPVLLVIAERAPNTLRIMLPALSIALLVSIVAALGSVRSAALDRTLGALTLAGVSAPIHILALLAILVFAVVLGWLPTGGVHGIADPSMASKARHAVLPIGVTAVFFASRYLRFLRGSLADALAAEHVQAARAKGLDERRILLAHVLPNALLPLITVVAQSLPVLFSGTVVLERAFAYPGIGLLIFESIDQDDPLVAVVAVTIGSAITMVAMAAGDEAYALADPRTRR